MSVYNPTQATSEDLQQIVKMDIASLMKFLKTDDGQKTAEIRQACSSELLRRENLARLREHGVNNARYLRPKTEYCNVM